NELFSGHLRDEEVSASFLSGTEYVNRHGRFTNGLPGRNWVIALYNDVLHRDPLDREIQNILAALAAGQSPSAIALGFTASPEKQVQEITDSFTTLLGRTPLSDDINQYLDAFLQGRLTVEELRGDFIGSGEYFSGPAKGNNNNARWVRSAYA